jgi:hypothetical protein
MHCDQSAFARYSWEGMYRSNNIVAKWLVILMDFNVISQDQIPLPFQSSFIINKECTTTMKGQYVLSIGWGLFWASTDAKFSHIRQLFNLWSIEIEIPCQKDAIVPWCNLYISSATQADTNIKLTQELRRIWDALSLVIAMFGSGDNSEIKLMCKFQENEMVTQQGTAEQQLLQWTNDLWLLCCALANLPQQNSSTWIDSQYKGIY